MNIWSLLLSREQICFLPASFSIPWAVFNLLLLYLCHFPLQFLPQFSAFFQGFPADCLSKCSFIEQSAFCTLLCAVCILKRCFCIPYPIPFASVSCSASSLSLSLSVFIFLLFLFSFSLLQMYKPYSHSINLFSKNDPEIPCPTSTAHYTNPFLHYWNYNWSKYYKLVKFLEFL